MKSLYEIKQSIIDALDNATRHAEENDGEITEEMSKELDALEIAKEKKIGNICRYYKSLNAEAEMIKNEEKNLSDRRKVTENKAQRLKDYLSAMLDGEKYSDSVSKVSWKSSKSVIVTDQNDVPAIYTKTIKTVSVDKMLVKTQLLKGIKIDGCELKESNNIQIK